MEVLKSQAEDMEVWILYQRSRVSQPEDYEVELNPFPGGAVRIREFMMPMAMIMRTLTSRKTA